MEETKQNEKTAFALPGSTAPGVVIIVNVFHKEPEDVMQEMNEPENELQPTKATINIINPLKN